MTHHPITQAIHHYLHHLDIKAVDRRIREYLDSKGYEPLPKSLEEILVERFMQTCGISTLDATELAKVAIEAFETDKK